MKVIDEPKDQCLLCIGFDFERDSPNEREVALARFQPGVRQKEWWRYQHTYLGLRTLVAYQGARPVGQIEFIPIEHAPRPVAGQGLTLIDCLYVAEHARGVGVGHGLLQAAEAEAQTHSAGMALVGHSEGGIMPAGFFERWGYRCVATRGEERLLYKPFHAAEPPSFLSIAYHRKPPEEAVAVDFFHCSQCLYSGWALERFRQAVRAAHVPAELRVIDTGERRTIEMWGIAQAVYIDGFQVGGFPPTPESLINAFDSALAARALNTAPPTA
jgi:GNAT superfamily N-acetyltransferase